MTSSCVSLDAFKPSEKVENKIKRSWVRRLVPDESLLTNEIAQNFAPVLTSNGNVVQGSTCGELYELNPYGRIVWSYKVSEGISGQGSVYENFVFFGGLDKKLYALDSKDRELLWSIELDSGVSSISDFKGGRIFVLTSLGGLYAVDASSGAIQWKVSYPSKKSLKIYGGAKPLIIGGLVVAGFPNGVVASLSQNTGKVFWEKSLEGSQKYEDVDFLSYTEGGYLIAGVFDVAVYRLDVKTGQVLWQAYEEPVSAPAIRNGNLYFSSAKKELISLGLSTGNLVYRAKLFDGVGGKPLFYKNGYVVTDSKGPVRYVSLDGEVIDDYDLVSGTSSDLTLNKSLNKFFLFSDKGYLYSLGVE